MVMAKNKAYVVWAGVTPGVYNTWAECEAQTKGFAGAKFKGFPSKELANDAFAEKAGAHIGQAKAKSPVSAPSSQFKTPSIEDSTYLTVDAAYSQKTKILEWRGVLVENGNETEVFRSHPYRNASANIGEFLSLIDGLEYLEANNLKMPIYSDSITAQAWVRKKRHNSNVDTSPNLIAMLDRADRLLQDGIYEKDKSNIQIKDWPSKAWGEIPADFGRKQGKGMAMAEGPVL
jgi:ribonuclease HI